MLPLLPASNPGKITENLESTALFLLFLLTPGVETAREIFMTGFLAFFDGRSAAISLSNVSFSGTYRALVIKLCFYGCLRSFEAKRETRRHGMPVSYLETRASPPYFP